MGKGAKIALVQEIMSEFADATGLSDGQKPARRYLWTDAFAVCNFLELYRQTGNRRWRLSALALIDQVHEILGRHRTDDPRSGWISGLDEAEGRAHPTRGGLRIGKALNERGPAAPFDERLEWDRDGQYYHYLTRWMQALDQASRATANPVFNLWAVELAKAAHKGFVHVLRDGSKRIIWKMSIDLTRALMPSMGHHDPLDGLITCRQLQETATELGAAPPALTTEIADLEELCQSRDWTTDDPLGIGGLLSDACTLAQLTVKGRVAGIGLLLKLLQSARRGLKAYAGGNRLGLPAEDRLAFRELGMAIGLHALERIAWLAEERADIFGTGIQLQIERLKPHVGLSATVEGFWLEPGNRRAASWTEHRDINSVMLATSLAPDGCLKL